MNQDAVAAILARVAQRESVPLPLLLAALTAMVQPGERPDLARIEHNLERKAREYRRLHQRLTTPVGTDAELDRLRADAARLLGEGRFAEADRALAQSELRNLDGTIALDKMPKERLLAAAGGRAERGATAMLQQRADAYREAAQRFAEAAVIAGAADPEHARLYGWLQADALARIGEDLGDSLGFEAAIANLRTMLARLDNFDDTVPWARTQDRLARALTGLGTLEGGTARQAEAVGLYRTALEDLTRKLDQELWRGMQHRLGQSLLALGEAGNDPALLEDSVEALAAALSATSRAQGADWAELQFDHGKALAALGLRSSGAGHLEAAVNAFRHVLDIWQRETNPLQWAEAQDRMGRALCGLATYYREPVVLEEALAAFDAALDVRRRETLPALWALTSAHRADAGLTLAQRLADPALAEQATSGLRAAVEALRATGQPERARRFETRLDEAAALVAKPRAAP